MGTKRLPKYVRFLERLATSLNGVQQNIIVDKSSIKKSADAVKTKENQTNKIIKILMKCWEEFQRIKI